MERLGHHLVKFLPELVAFFLVGREFRERNARSLRDVAKRLGKAVVPPSDCVSLTHSSLSKALDALAKEVFEVYFGRQGIRLLQGELGQSSRLSPDGDAAWELTRAYLARCGLLPGG